MSVHPARQSYTAWLAACGMALQGPTASPNATPTTLTQHSQTARDACPSASAPVPTSTLSIISVTAFGSFTLFSHV